MQGLPKEVQDVLATGAALLHQIDKAGLDEGASPALDTRLFYEALSRFGVVLPPRAYCPGCGGNWARGVHTACIEGLSELQL